MCGRCGKLEADLKGSVVFIVLDHAFKVIGQIGHHLNHVLITRESWLDTE